MSRTYPALLLTAIALLVAPFASADEPNEYFDEATVLSPGVNSVYDSLGDTTLDPPIDTILTAAGTSGSYEFFDDDGSYYGNGRASALFEVPILNNSINFTVSGYPDETFEGQHSEYGDYEAYVSIYDINNELIDSVYYSGTLVPGAVDTYAETNANWAGATYNIELENILEPRDVDFWTFTGLPTGAQFVARTSASGEVEGDTIIGWFDETGTELDYNDDDPTFETYYSRLTGEVPANGEVTIVVTGWPDYYFTGYHADDTEYVLDIWLSGDFNLDGSVDLADYTVWRDHLGDETDDALDNLGDGEPGVTIDDYAIWKANFGASIAFPEELSQASVPEPTSLALLLLAAVGLVTTCRHR
ncbi:PEP-CTERM sorting domain-containing protein [Aeoliella mucimassa]|uniref:PEP-CTERM protein-sorting domain-containing protein n=1 Tax=Aeoliella mucimassa TaxID=2527972 RepID=A0A518AIU5_9BACT|nr:PEP-CTERM sorting domain-containing protein [Aeoliella mucimassa]QDU54658.1 hypothetical protein Pan181_08410 [Aeoliella mucimassa]